MMIIRTGTGPVPPPALNITCPVNQTEQVIDPVFCLSVNFPQPQINGGVPPFNISYNPPQDSVLCVGLTPIEITVTDSVGQVKQCTFNVQVNQIPANPNLSVVFPGDQSYQVNAPQTCLVVDLPTPSPSGGVPPYSVFYNPPDFSSFCVGTTPVQASVFDSTSPTPQNVIGNFNVIVTQIPAGSPNIIFKTNFSSSDAAGWSSVPFTQIGAGCGGAGFGGIQSGVSSAGGWSTFDCDRVIAADGLTAGEGMFRHARGVGTNSLGGGLRLDIPPNGEIWFRYYARYSLGASFSGGVPHYTKDIFWHNLGGGPNIIIGFNNNGSYINGGVAGAYYASIPANPAGQNVNSSLGWQGIMGGPTGNGVWNAYEQYINLNTGQLILWFNGTEVLNTSVGYGGSSMSYCTVGENQDFVTSDFYTDFARIAVANSGGPIGLFQAGRGF